MGVNFPHVPICEVPQVTDPPDHLLPLANALYRAADALHRAVDGSTTDMPVPLWAPYCLEQLRRLRKSSGEAILAVEAAWNAHEALPIQEPEDDDDAEEPDTVLLPSTLAATEGGGA